MQQVYDSVYNSKLLVHRTNTRRWHRLMHFSFDPLYTEVKQRKDRAEMEDAVYRHGNALVRNMHLIVQCTRLSAEYKIQNHQGHACKGSAECEKEISECCFHNGLFVFDYIKRILCQRIFLLVA